MRKRSDKATVQRRTAQTSLVALTALGVSVFGMSTAHATGHYGAAKSSRSTGVSRVKIVDDSFSPKKLVVRVGTTVVWTNTDNDAHTVTRSSRNPLDSGTLKAGKSYRFTFHRPGRYIYHCEYHSLMRGTIVVLPARHHR